MESCHWMFMRGEEVLQDGRALRRGATKRERGGALAELIHSELRKEEERRWPSYRTVRQLHLTVLKTPVGLAGLTDGLRGFGEAQTVSNSLCLTLRTLTAGPPFAFC